MSTYIKLTKKFKSIFPVTTNAYTSDEVEWVDPTFAIVNIGYLEIVTDFPNTKEYTLFSIDKHEDYIKVTTYKSRNESFLRNINQLKDIEKLINYVFDDLDLTIKDTFFIATHDNKILDDMKISAKVKCLIKTKDNHEFSSIENKPQKDYSVEELLKDI